MQVITSDLHLGSEYCDVTGFLRFLDALPDGAELVLNGDTLDAPGVPLRGQHEDVWQRLAVEAERLRLVWVFGNHDREGGAAPECAETYEQYAMLDGDTLVAHGDAFDAIMPRAQWFIRWFRRFHRLRVRLGASPVHVARYAKNWAVFYRFLRSSVRNAAVDEARQLGAKNVVCGHVHYPEHSVVDGINYFNTGCWTEDDPHFVMVKNGTLRLRPCCDLAFVLNP